MASLTELIQQEADRCVKCGLCLPHCPTYVKTQHEGESPRGRIALFEGVAKQQLPITKTLQQHIDQCLSCRACEIVCPAEVEYEKLFLHGKQYLMQQKAYRLSFLKKIINYSLLHPVLLKTGFALIRFLQKCGAPIYPKLNTAIKLKTFYPSTAKPIQGKIALSPGCVHSHTDVDTIQNSIKLLNTIGYDVYIPSKFICCGALHAHSGQANTAKKLALQNKNLFNQLNVNTIISTATGCTPILQNHLHNVIDINTFLLQAAWPDDIQFKTLSKKVLLHTPCTLRNALKQMQSPIELLKKIPNLDLILLDNKQCCGGSGTYFLEHAVMAENLANDIIVEVKTKQADIFLTTNIGCAIHLQREFAKQKLKVEVLHPVTLLSRQLYIP